MVSNIYSLYFVLTGTYFAGGTVAKHPEQCVGVCVGVNDVQLTTVEHCFHVKTLRQEQIGLPFEGLRGR